MLAQSIHASGVYDNKPHPEDLQPRCRIATIDMIKLGESNMELASNESAREV